MIELICFIAFVLILAGLAIRERKRAASYDFSKLPDANWKLTEYTGNGQHRDYYAEFDAATGKFVPDLIYKACELLEQRRSGRWAGRSVTVSWTPGLDEGIDGHAKWLAKHGSRWGVFVREARRAGK